MPSLHRLMTTGKVCGKLEVANSGNWKAHRVRSVFGGYGSRFIMSRQPISVRRDSIVVVHGFAGKRVWMYPLCFRLRSRGFRVTNWGYSSLWHTIAEHPERLREYLAHSLSDEPCVHIIAHSMGAIVVRSALAMGPVANLGRVILFAPPNQGTPVARHARDSWGVSAKGLRICPINGTVM